jgi:cobalt-zinc-cadmium efflux system outer membrane protein
MPPGVSLEAGLREDQAIVLALWNNSAFQELLVELDFARADLVQANQVPNPELWILSALGPKQLEYAVEWPVEALWLRPRRTEVAAEETLRITEVLVQASLNLIRDVRVTYADAILAEDRLHIARDAEALRRRIAALTEARLKAGDATPFDAAIVRTDLLRAEQDVRRLQSEQQRAQERLHYVVGLGTQAGFFRLQRNSLPALQVDVEDLVQAALTGRPDLLGAERAVAAAQARRRLAACDWFQCGAIIDANGRGDKGFEIGPGLRVTIPLFHQNQGRMARADAEIERAHRQHLSLRHRVTLEVRQAHLEWLQAHTELERWRVELRPLIAEAITKVERAYREGDVPLVTVLESSRQLLDAQNREALLRAEVRKAVAELERSVGRRLTSSSTVEATPEPCQP